MIIAGTYIIVEACIQGEGTRFDDYTSRIYAIATATALFDNMALYSGTLSFMLDSSGFVALFTYMRIVYAYICD